jgi:hypothetical protein
VNQSVVEETRPGQKHKRKVVIIDWDDRSVEESFDDVRTFAHDLSQAIEERLDTTTNPASS